MLHGLIVARRPRKESRALHFECDSICGIELI
jgi:hypothetical protein